MKHYEEEVNCANDILLIVVAKKAHFPFRVDEVVARNEALLGSFESLT
jgi:hypothetical protein